MEKIKKNFGFGCMRLPMQGEDVDLGVVFGERGDERLDRSGALDHGAVQCAVDPEQTCDALLAWQHPEIVPRHFLRDQTSPRIHLLREFGRALRVFPDLGASLAVSPPVPLRYDTEQMARFLKTQADHGKFLVQLGP